MKTITFLLIAAISLSGCVKFDHYIWQKSKRPDLLIGYQKVHLKNNIPPSVEISFGHNDSVLDEEAITRIGQALTDNSYYIVEATAGGHSKNSVVIQEQRIINLVQVLESFGIDSNDIYVAEYAAHKSGRRGFVYSVSH